MFCDESGTDRRDGARRAGWWPKGQGSPWCSADLQRGKRYHVLPALTVDGFLDTLVFRGQANSDGFVEWLRLSILPKMNPFPGRYSILVIDNALWH